MAADGLAEASPFRLLRDTFGSGTSHNVIFIGDKRTIAKVLNLYLDKSAYFWRFCSPVSRDQKFDGVELEDVCAQPSILQQLSVAEGGKSEFMSSPGQHVENSCGEL